MTARTPVLTTVHELQIVRAAIPMTAHDMPLDLIVTPDRVIRTRTRRAKPRGIRRDELSPAQIRAMPAVARLAPVRAARTRPRAVPTT